MDIISGKVVVRLFFHRFFRLAAFGTGIQIDYDKVARVRRDRRESLPMLMTN